MGPGIFAVRFNYCLKLLDFVLVVFCIGIDVAEKDGSYRIERINLQGFFELDNCFVVLTKFEVNDSKVVKGFNIPVILFNVFLQPADFPLGA